MNFSPEQEKAYSVLKENLPIYHSLIVDNFSSKPFETNYKAFSRKPILKESLPHESWWVWNQSNAKVERWLNENIKVTMQKFNPRKRAGYREKKASYKLWLFCLTNKRMEHQLSFLWCEKGVPSVNSFLTVDTPLFFDSFDPCVIQAEPEIQYMDIEDTVTLDSLSFLKSFVDPNTAAQFGWF